jgi:hypothetical protein
MKFALEKNRTYILKQELFIHIFEIEKMSLFKKKNLSKIQMKFAFEKN